MHTHTGCHEKQRTVSQQLSHLFQAISKSTQITVRWISLRIFHPDQML